MRVIAPFGWSVESIANLGCSRIASRFVDVLFEAKIAAAVERVTAAKAAVAVAQSHADQVWRQTFGRHDDGPFEEQYELELAEYQLEQAMEQHDAVLEEKDRCYWKVAYGKEYF